VYRHAVSCIAPAAPVEQKRQPVQPRPALAKPSSSSSQPVRRPVSPRPTQPRPQALSASAGDPNINNSMKEGLLKWMQEQKAAK